MVTLERDFSRDRAHVIDVLKACWRWYQEQNVERMRGKEIHSVILRIQTRKRKEERLIIYKTTNKLLAVISVFQYLIHKSANRVSLHRIKKHCTGKKDLKKNSVQRQYLSPSSSSSQLLWARTNAHIYPSLINVFYQWEVHEDLHSISWSHVSHVVEICWVRNHFWP